MNRTNHVPEPEVWDGIRKDSRGNSKRNTIAAKLRQAIDENDSLEARQLGFKLGFRDTVNP